MGFSFYINFPTIHIKSHVAIIIFCSIFIFVGLIIDSIFGFNLYCKNNNLTDIRQTEGTVISYEINKQFNNGSGKYDETYLYTAEYEYDGKKYTAVTMLDHNNYAVGDKVTVEFNIKSFVSNIIEKNFLYYAGQFLPIFIGTVFIAIGTMGVVLKIKKIKQERSVGY